MCLGRLWDVNWPGEGTVFDRLTVVKGEYTDAAIERALRVCKRRPQMWFEGFGDLRNARRAAQKAAARCKPLEAAHLS